MHLLHILQMIIQAELYATVLDPIQNNFTSAWEHWWMHVGRGWRAQEGAK